MNITSKLNQIIQECLVNRDSDLFIMPRFDKYQLLYRDAEGTESLPRLIEMKQNKL